MEKLREFKWSASITGIVLILVSLVLWAGDTRYVRRDSFKGQIQCSLIEFELNKIRVELAMMNQRKVFGELTKKEIVELDMLKAYQADLVRQQNYWRNG